jgi:3-oxoacyl-[acyl-carrier protein] reductase
MRASSGQFHLLSDSRSQSRAVLITGASGGIGQALSLAFAKAGWFVGVHYHQNKVGAEETLKEIERAGATGTVFQADIRNAAATRQMVEGYCGQVSVPSVFVCNAGIATSHLLLRQPDDDWANVIATNLTGTFHCLRAIAPPLLAHGGGSIIVLGSHAGFQGSTGQAAYAASKAGLIGLVKTAAQEWGPQNVKVNLVLPGWQETGLSEGAISASCEWQNHALRRPPTREEVARTVLHIAQLHDVSGQVWNCDSRML